MYMYIYVRTQTQRHVHAHENTQCVMMVMMKRGMVLNMIEPSLGVAPEAESSTEVELRQF